MKHVAPLVALGLSAGLLPGCGAFEAPTFTQPAAVEGYFRGEDVTIVTDQWVQYVDEHDAPYGEVRNVRVRKVQDGCHEETDYYGIGFDDPSCWDSLCDSDEGTYCKPTYVDRYDYQELEEVTIEDCPAPVTPREFKSEEIVRDAACMARRKDGERFKSTGKFVVWLRTKKPGKTEPGKP